MGKERQPQKMVFHSVVDGLKQLYRARIRPVEEKYQFSDFYSPLMTDVDFESKPMVLLLGQYSVGKTSFIKYLLGRDFPGAHIGPEPTTDRFMAVFYGPDERVIPGNALAVQADKPFRALERFGTGFLNKFAGSQAPCEVLEHLMLIDTPGVLSGEKQRLGRTYDFAEVTEWFAERADMILLLFDAHKLDISDEFKRAIEVLRGQDDKVRVVLNKADAVTTQQLMRVYGALMWSLGKVMQTPEVCRVYIGSFWNEPCKNETFKSLFEAEMADLLQDLYRLPNNNALRKVNELVKRCRLAKCHAHIISYLRNEMPSVFGKDKKKKELLAQLPDVFNKVRLRHNLHISDFPSIERFARQAELLDWNKFAKMEQKMLEDMDHVLSVDIPNLLRMFPQDNERIEMARASAAGNPFADASPFATTSAVVDWTLRDADREKYALAFAELAPADGRLSGVQAKKVLGESGLPNAALMKIWSLSDIDHDGHLDLDEFCVAMYLVYARQAGYELPASLPASLFPASKMAFLPAAPSAPA